MSSLVGLDNSGTFSGTGVPGFHISPLKRLQSCSSPRLLANRLLPASVALGYSARPSEEIDDRQNRGF